VYYGLRKASRSALTVILVLLAAAVLWAAYVVSQSVPWLGIVIAL